MKTALVLLVLSSVVFAGFDMGLDGGSSLGGDMRMNVLVCRSKHHSILAPKLILVGTKNTVSGIEMGISGSEYGGMFEVFCAKATRRYVGKRWWVVTGFKIGGIYLCEKDEYGVGFEWKAGVKQGIWELTARFNNIVTDSVWGRELWVVLGISTKIN